MYQNIFGLLVGALIAAVAIETYKHKNQYLKQQAFDRGYMVQCVGKTGYYWECDDAPSKGE